MNERYPARWTLIFALIVILYCIVGRIISRILTGGPV